MSACVYVCAVVALAALAISAPNWIVATVSGGGAVCLPCSAGKCEWEDETEKFVRQSRSVSWVSVWVKMNGGKRRMNANSAAVKVVFWIRRDGFAWMWSNAFLLSWNGSATKKIELDMLRMEQSIVLQYFEINPLTCHCLLDVWKENYYYYSYAWKSIYSHLVKRKNWFFRGLDTKQRHLFAINHQYCFGS